MIDPISLSIALGAILLSIMSQIKKSKCMSMEIETRTPPHTTQSPFVLNRRRSVSLPVQIVPINSDETTPLLKSSPIDIPKKEEKRIYL